MNNSPPGHELFRDYDEFGPVHVHEDGGRRILSFGTPVEQSCVWLDDPAKLTYAYTQAMMLALLMVRDAPRIALLGLGAGSMVQCLLKHAPLCYISAIERRRLVADVAQRFFVLPVTANLDIHIAEALDYLSATSQSFDVLFADLYDANGMDESQTTDDLLSLSHQRLADGGVAVFNLWNIDYAAARKQTANIELIYPYVARLTVPGGNRLLFAFRDEPPHLVESSWVQDAQTLALRMNIPLLRFARALWADNRDLLASAGHRKRKSP